MRTSSKGIDLIKHFEGLELEAYKCPADVWTIGYGTTRGVREGMRIDESQAEEFLVEDLEKFERAVENLVEVDINQNMFDALVSFTYNLGQGNLSSSTLLKKLNSSDYEGAANEFPRWTRAGGKVLPGLVRRREAERELFLS